MMMCQHFRIFFVFIMSFFVVEASVFYSDISSTWVKISDKTRAKPVPYSGTVFPTVLSWYHACSSQPKYRNGANFEEHHSGFLPLGSQENQWQEFSRILFDWFEIMKVSSLSNADLWQNIGSLKQPHSIFFDCKQFPPFTPFAQKIIAAPGDEFFIRGDLHGDIFSLLEQLKKMTKEHVLDDNFRIIKDNVWILFLGDYVDRGQYGCEVLYTMLRLSLANPDRVIFVRGNHEDVEIQAYPGGFKEEVRHKFDDLDGSKHKIISRMNDFLPVVLYIGCQNANIINYLQCCHGGLEIGYDPRPFLDDRATIYQLLGLLHQKTFIENFEKYCDGQSSGVLNNLRSWIKPNPWQEMKKWWINVKSLFYDNRLLEKPIDAISLGFMWNDFDVANVCQVRYEPSRGLTYGKELTEKILELQSSATSKICGVFRAHQHGDEEMMQNLKRNGGVYKLWNADDRVVAKTCNIMENYRTLVGGKVWTFNVGADSIYGVKFGFNFDAYARLVVQEQLKDWKLQVFNTIVM